MADVTGPVSTLPGSQRAADCGARCDHHPNRYAVRRVQGETDSFGAEFHDLCQECVDTFNAHRHDSRHGTCDWCKSTATDLRPHRDFEEGMAGRVYDVCGACVRREREALEDELEESGYYDRDYD